MRRLPAYLWVVMLGGLVAFVMGIIWAVDNPFVPGRRLILGIPLVLWFVPLLFALSSDWAAWRGRRAATDPHFVHGLCFLSNATGVFAPGLDVRGKPFKPGMIGHNGWMGVRGMFQATEAGVSYRPSRLAVRRGCRPIDIEWGEVMWVRAVEQKSFTGGRALFVEVATPEGVVAVTVFEPEGAQPQAMQRALTKAG